MKGIYRAASSRAAQGPGAGQGCSDRVASLVVVNSRVSVAGAMMSP